MSIFPTSVPSKTLAQNLSSTGLTLYVSDTLSWDGSQMSSADFGTQLFATLRNPTSTQVEFIEIDPATITSSNTITILKRGLPYSGLQTANAETAYAWNAFDTIVELGTSGPQLLKELVEGSGDETVTGIKTFSSIPLTTGGSPSTDNQLARKAYVDAVASGGSGIPNRVVVSGTAGETITAGQLVYLKASDNRWWLTDADTAATVENVQLGIAQGVGAAAGAVTNGVLISGVDSNQTGLTANTKYFASNTAGGLSTSAGTTEVSIGITLSTTSILFMPRFDQDITEDIQDALAGTSGTPSASNKYATDADTSTTGSGSKIPRGVSGKIDSTWLPDAPFGALASGENLTAGQPVYVNPSDSTVYIAHGYKQIDTTALTLTATATGRLAKLSNTQYLYLGHSGATLTLYLRNITTNSDLGSTAVTTAYDQTVTSTVTMPNATVCRLSDTTFIVLYAKTTDNNLYFRTGSVSGSTITFDTETVYPGSFDFCFGFSSVPGASNGKVVFSYLDASTASGDTGTVIPKLAYLTVATNSVTVTHAISGATLTNGAYNVGVVWTACAFTEGVAYGMFCIVNASNVKQIKYNTIEVNSGGTTADNVVPNLESQTGAGVSPGYTLYVPSLVGHNGKIYFGWATNDGGAPYVNTKTIFEASQSGARIFYQSSTVKLGGDTTVEALSMVGNEMGVVVFGFMDTDNSKRVNLYIQRGSIYQFYDMALLSITSGVPNVSLWYSNQKDEVVVGNDGNYIKTWRLPTLVDGAAASSVTSPASVVIFSNVVTTSGLTANAKYFLKDTYTTVGDMDFKGVIPVGRALSTTVMNLKVN